MNFKKHDIVIPSKQRKTVVIMNEALSIDNLTKKYKNKIALDDFSMKIMPGEIVALIGENGAGKTTLLNSICGFIRPTSGSISFKGISSEKEKH